MQVDITQARNGSYVHLHVPYPVDNRYGIDVNQILLGAVIGAYCDGVRCDKKNYGSLTPKCAPWWFATGITIR
jgi:hypothetical protein